MNFLISDAVAAADALVQDNPISLVLILVVFDLTFYFVILRPQQRRTREHKELMDSIARGNEVLTSSGLVGHVTKITESGYITIALDDIIGVAIKYDFTVAILPKSIVKTL